MTSLEPATLTLTRIIKATPEKVFDAWTNAETLVRWWGPGTTTCPEAHIDLTVGGAIRIANKRADGSIIWITGAFVAIERPRLLEYAWTMGEMMDAPTEVLVEFKPHASGTELVLTHTRFANAEIRDAHEKGWHGCIDKLADFVA